jgi:type VI secretion system secreted protein VgrG
MQLQLTRPAQFSSSLKDQVELYSMTGREQLGRLFTYEVDLLSTDDSLDLSALLGQPASVQVQRNDHGVREFTGYVTQFSLVGEHGNYTRYRATLRPWLWFLGQNRNCRIFQGQTVPEIIKTLLSEHGLGEVSSKLDGTYHKWEYLVQYRESDLSFITRLMEHEGIYYFFTHADGKHKLVLADSIHAHPTPEAYKHTGVHYHPASSAREAQQNDILDTWVLSRQIRQGHVTLRDFNFTYPQPFDDQRNAPLKMQNATYELYDYPGVINQLTVKEAKEAAAALAEIRVEEQQADYDTTRGGGPIRGLGVGDVFSLTNFPREDQNKSHKDKAHLIVSASYSITVAEFESNIVEGAQPVFRFELSAIDSKQPYRLPRITPKPIVEGPQTATVVGDPKQEVWTDEYGRIKLKFHWDRSPVRDQGASCWVRVSQAWAGHGWGNIHVPRINQEVIVQFLDGDPDRPIVTGCVYNKEQPAPYGKDQLVSQSGWKSHSTPGGGADNFNEIRFEDKKGSEELHVQAEKDMTTLIKHDRTTNILRNDTLNITGDQFIKIHGNLSMIVEGVTEKDNPDKKKPVKSSLGVTGAHRIDASDTIDIQAPNKITLTVGGSTITMTPGSITISAGGSTVAVDANVFAKSKGEAQMKLDANGLMKSAGGAIVELKGGTAVSSGSGGGSVTLDGDAAVKAGNIKLNAGKINGTGDSEIGLTVASSSVKLTPASVETTATAVKSTGTGAVEVTAPAIKLG